MNAYEEKMIKEMQLRNFTVTSQKTYLAVPRLMGQRLNRPADQITTGEIKNYLLHLQNDRKLATSSVSHTLHVLKFLVNVILQRTSDPLIVTSRKSDRSLPEILSIGEVKLLIESADNLRSRVILLLAYSAGLRMSEIIKLKATDIDSSRMMIYVRLGKCHKDRYTILSPYLLAQLRAYWRQYRPKDHFFPSYRQDRHASVALIHKAYLTAKFKSGIKKGRGIHSLRHCFGTHLLEAGVDLRTIQVLMGHSSILTTSLYLKVTEKKFDQAKNAIDLLSQY
jgi:integrase/recombinase XerD